MDGHVYKNHWFLIPHLLTDFFVFLGVIHYSKEKKAKCGRSPHITFLATGFTEICLLDAVVYTNKKPYIHNLESNQHDDQSGTIAVTFLFVHSDNIEVIVFLSTSHVHISYTL